MAWEESVLIRELLFLCVRAQTTPHTMWHVTRPPASRWNSPQPQHRRVRAVPTYGKMSQPQWCLRASAFMDRTNFSRGVGWGVKAEFPRCSVPPAASDTGRQLEQSAKKRCRREVRNGLTWQRLVISVAGLHWKFIVTARAGFLSFCFFFLPFFLSVLLSNLPFVLCYYFFYLGA